MKTEMQSKPDGSSLDVAAGSAFRPGDIVTLNVRFPIWNGIECRLIEKHEDTGQWKMETVHGTKYTVYYYEDDFFPNSASEPRRPNA